MYWGITSISVGILNLLLMLGVIRRVNRNAEAVRRTSDVFEGPPAIAVGQEVGTFAATTVDGDPISRESLLDDSVVAFLSPHCPPCLDKIPGFIQYAKELPSGRDQVLAVALGSTESTAEMVADLAPVSQVVVEEHTGALSKAFEVTAFPTLVRVAVTGDGRVVIADNNVRLDLSGVR
ncbi:TlpA family protein disulfide reductase [Spirillospora sp. NPDC048911]|uniref:TlpA family protein disulfide reductase n=1 Tax=Spirillospora sp. NPDC048911 TaxID=3364527 RepID=UPI0037221586